MSNLRSIFFVLIASTTLVLSRVTDEDACQCLVQGAQTYCGHALLDPMCGWPHNIYTCDPVKQLGHLAVKVKRCFDAPCDQSENGTASCLNPRNFRADVKEGKAERCEGCAFKESKHIETSAGATYIDLYKGKWHLFVKKDGQYTPNF